MEDDDPLDFDREDLSIPRSIMKAKPKKKVIGLDELLQEYYQEKINVVERESKKLRMHASDSSDEEDDKSVKKKEKQLCAFVNECERQVNKLSATVNVESWGKRIFGPQKAPPVLHFPGSDACPLLQALSENDELKVIADLSIENGEAFMVELLVTGWLQKLVLSRGHCDEFTVRWAFNLMAYSSNESHEVCACNFLCSIILSGSEGASHFCVLDWVPSGKQIKEIVQIYGYLEYGMGDKLIVSKREDNDDFEFDGPPVNIRSWLKFVSACSQARSRAILATSDAEELAVMVIQFFLERQLHCLFSLLKECLATIVRFFTDEQWFASLQEISFSLRRSIPGKDFNCIRLVESLSGVDTRIKELQKDVALGMLLNCIGKQEYRDAKEIIDLLTATNVRDKLTDFVQMYICLVLADAWLWCNPVITENSTVETWLHYLRGCSCQISSTDWRAYASKVRNKASYLIQMYEGQK
ncbi:uncharacterized protein LOC131050246 [Cryptomeria japonica]|uniref:uncharacterized protein LOC131050246 n=1 Tax=Cryptomeria japonica TaxID=3369 RepID=UPI0025ACFCD6|nr:uncharacterized protein LOC131050246 [Cryptomeria japonica]XP_057840415.1 uncharacterized protein LOC131050246 [Cryptomeria japonica]XP_057840416.1 uncharacterized protein LOC131050246 [Cryptomeria japonica]XP_057840417.1 uncharacterized protein LOC131050246 [Cryptomeria japonica]